MALSLSLRPTVTDVAALLFGGVVGLLAWEFFVGTLVPEVFGGPRFGPVGLVGAVLNAVVGFNPGREVNEILHYATGIVFYQVALFGLIALTRRVAGVVLPTIVWGLAWGVATWFIAMGVFASIAGFGFMLGFNAITWWSLAGHVVYAVTAVSVFAAARSLVGLRRQAA